MLTFQTSEERIAKFKKTNALIVGESGRGKTFCARSLDPAGTLFVDCEAGTMSLERTKTLPAWGGDTLDMLAMSQKMNIHPWILCRGIASLLLGPDPSDKPDGAYHANQYAQYVQFLANGNPDIFAKYHSLFIDSLTVVGRWCFDWCKTQPRAFSEKTGKPDIRGAYGLLAEELVAWTTKLQLQQRNMFLSCILEQKEDDFKRMQWKLQLDGSSGEKIKGIFDLVLTIANVDFGEPHGTQKVFVTQEGNELGYPAKDRSGLLDPFERPDLGALLAKIQNFHNQQA